VVQLPLPTIRLIDCFAGHLLPQLGRDESLAVSAYSKEQIGNKGDTCTDQADDPRIAESRLICREFGPSILFREGLDNLQHQRFAVLLIAHQDHAIALLLICEENG
jgi:hypothetical protein